MALVKCLLVFLTLKDGIDPDDIGNEAFTVLELNQKVRKKDGILAVSRKCCAQCDVDLRVIRHPEGIDLLCEGSFESVSELRVKEKRAAQESDISLDGSAACKA